MASRLFPTRPPSPGSSSAAKARRRVLFTLVSALALVGAGFSGLASAGPDASDTGLRVVVISDMNESYGSTRYSEHVSRAVARIIEMQPALVISTGDMVAGQRIQPSLTRNEIEPMWGAFHGAVSDPIARAGLPLAVTPGNHDASTGTRFELERQIFREQWLARKPTLNYIDATGYPFHYAFALGPALFVSLDATYVGHISEGERRWLDHLLQQHGAAFQYRVVFSHIPLWPFAQGRESDYLGDEALERILRKHGVDLYLSGHHHAYYPAAKDGIRYVSQACLGAAPRPLIGSDLRTERAITVLDFNRAGGISVEAYRAPEYTERIPRQTLPERVTSKRATLVRDDLAPATSEPRRK